MTATSIRRLDLPLGESIPVLGQGTAGMGEDPERWDAEVTALQLGFDLGMTLVETGEMYGNGAAEELVGDALVGRRDDVFLVTKVGPAHASRREIAVACEQSLQRLRTAWIDLYLLHGRGFELLDETLEGLDELLRMGKISFFGVSLFSVANLEELTQVRDGVHVQTDEVPYNLLRRGIELDLLPWCRARGIPVMACSPVLATFSIHTTPCVSRHPPVVVMQAIEDWECHDTTLGAEAGHDLQRRRTIGRDLDSVTARAQQQCEDLADVLLVVHHQDRPRPHFGAPPRPQSAQPRPGAKRATSMQYRACPSDPSCCPNPSPTAILQNSNP